MGEKLTAWGKPNITLFGQPIDANVTMLHVDENDIKDDGMIFRIPDETPIISFDVKLDDTVYKTMRKLFKYRMPRKFKKKVKTLIAKRFGIKANKIRFNMTVFNNQKRRKRYERRMESCKARRTQ